MLPHLMSDADLSAALATLPDDEYPTAANGVHWSHEEIKRDAAFLCRCRYDGVWALMGRHQWTCPCGSTFYSDLGPAEVMPW
jgi:hypothetical protein